MIDTTFVNGTVVQPAWLNDVNDFTNNNYANIMSGPYNADNTGLVDAATALQTAIDDIGLLGGGTVFIPRGYFLLNTEVVVNYPNVQIIGSGFSGVGVISSFPGTRTSVVGGTVLIGGHSSGSVIRIKESGCSIQHLTVDANTARTTGASGVNYGIRVEADDTVGKTTPLTGLLTLRVTRQPNHGVYATGSITNSKFDRVHVDNCYGHGFYICGSVAAGRVNEQSRPGLMEITNCRSSRNAGHGLAVGSLSDVTNDRPYRVITTLFESFYNCSNPAILFSTHDVFLFGENHTFSGSACQGTAGGPGFVLSTGTALTFTGALVAATSGTLTVAWAQTTGAYIITFSSGARKYVTLTNGSTAVSWTGNVTTTASATWVRFLQTNGCIYVAGRYNTIHNARLIDSYGKFIHNGVVTGYPILVADRGGAFDTIEIDITKVYANDSTTTIQYDPVVFIAATCTNVRVIITDDNPDILSGNNTGSIGLDSQFRSAKTFNGTQAFTTVSADEVVSENFRSLPSISLTNGNNPGGVAGNLAAILFDAETYGTVIITSNRASGSAIVAHFRVGATLTHVTSMGASGTVSVNTGVLTNATGAGPTAPDGTNNQLNVWASAATNTLFIKNRTSTTVVYQVTFIGVTGGNYVSTTIT